MQKNSKSIQGKLYEAAERIFKKEKVDIYGSGRTDAGVHALRQVAHLDVKTVYDPDIIRMKMNDELPPDINIIEVMSTWTDTLLVMSEKDIAKAMSVLKF